MMAFQVTKDFALKEFTIQTPLERTKGYSLRPSDRCCACASRGLGMVEGFLNILPEARVGHDRTLP